MPMPFISDSLPGLYQFQSAIVVRLSTLYRVCSDTIYYDAYCNEPGDSFLMEGEDWQLVEAPRVVPLISMIKIRLAQGVLFTMGAKKQSMVRYHRGHGVDFGPYRSAQQDMLRTLCLDLQYTMTQHFSPMALSSDDPWEIVDTNGLVVKHIPSPKPSKTLARLLKQKRSFHVSLP